MSFQSNPGPLTLTDRPRPWSPGGGTSTLRMCWGFTLRPKIQQQPALLLVSGPLAHPAWMAV
eukprot:1924030-Lingulodinium_polyedra.AAC.1